MFKGLRFKGNDVKSFLFQMFRLGSVRAESKMNRTGLKDDYALGIS